MAALATTSPAHAEGPAAPAVPAPAIVAPPVVAPAAAPAADDAAPLGQPTVHVHTSDPRIKLWMAPRAGDPSGRFWPTPVCSGNCGSEVPAEPGARFYFDAPGMPSSRSFRLDDRRGDVHVLVHPGNGLWIGYGASLLACAAAGIVVSTALSASQLGHESAGVLLRENWPMLTLSGVGAIAGSLLIYYGTTRVSFGPDAAPKPNLPTTIGAGLVRGWMF